ncbi:MULTISPECIES: PP0621 family protein [unclassified Pseudomonas]|uniref:PP0621 family protein n=1 Tax=unclassified Pseudomonas TaxID=196821 RepID=UPI0025F9A605|nr:MULTISPECIES: PP0621 family protein [unclassified Pseudomonas]
MIRLIMWAALIAAAIWFFKRLTNGPVRKAKPAAPEIDAAPMVRCAQCGVHVPRDRALSQGQHWYCTEAHRLQGPAARDR